jgi:hypothetical protein
MTSSVTNPEQARQDLADILSAGRVEISDAMTQMTERGHRLVVLIEPAARSKSRPCDKAGRASDSSSSGVCRRAARPACAHSVPMASRLRHPGTSIGPGTRTTGVTSHRLTSRHTARQRCDLHPHRRPRSPTPDRLDATLASGPRPWIQDRPARTGRLADNAAREG